LLLLLMQHDYVPHARIDVDRKVCSVYVCLMRQKLLRHGLKIRTLWGYGYQLSQEHRRKAMELILSKCQATGSGTGDLPKRTGCSD